MTGSIGRMFNRQSSVCREDSFTASQRNAAPLKAEDHRHLFAKPQRSASVPPPQRQMLDEVPRVIPGYDAVFLHLYACWTRYALGMTCGCALLSFAHACHAPFGYRN